MKPILIALLLVSTSLSAQTWKTDLNEALREAGSSGKNVLLFFSVSDACDICRRLDHDVFQSQEFLDYAKDNLVLVKLDFKNQASQDKADQLLIVEKYNKDGFFPWVVIVNANQKVVGKLPMYEDQSIRQYLSQIKAANR
ncbi:thioredoxin family protein [Flavobacterium sp. MAH-1]|uniref:Thioredoxin family protein n=1 Tax=Flavobacterium agri TaxID=2743471 RepID=A0A7Y9C664_9FLAO|nr:thioredoxin family protein [Flavobacterium agri]NUY79892.1 thioredoxin family protein [Flavobacterium agri]NYA69917.1 thioredoxin family protein [Flavobacterium agri]